MTKRFILSWFLPAVLLLPARIVLAAPAEFTLGNAALSRTMTVKKGVLSTSKIENKLAGSTLVPTACDEFAVRLSQGTDKPGTAITLTAKDFKVTDFKSEILKNGISSCVYTLKNTRHKIELKVRYTLGADDFYCRKQITLTSKNAWTIEKVDVERIVLADAKQNYTLKQISPDKHGGWKPGLGQPVYTTQTATFWGTEFPASVNTVTDGGLITCGYYRGKALAAGTAYESYKSVFGVSADKDIIDDAFYDYIDRIRIRPLRLQVQYNTWFDYGNRVTKETFAKSVRKVNHELVSLRGCKPLSAYVIDDGWQDKGKNADWSKDVWPINRKFTPGFRQSLSLVDSVGSRLGLWLSPACLFGTRPMVAKMKEYGFESLDYGMSMSGEQYMSRLERRMVELARDGVSYFKLDGIFGHLNTRDFELQGRGTAAMPQLGLEGFSTNDKRLNDSKYDELKTYYLTAGSERLMQILDKLHAVNPEVFVCLSNGAYLSPWWLMHADILWLINSSDAAKGASRSGELVYRDHIYHTIWNKENTKFPMSAIFNHEPKKLTTQETPAEFRDYLFMSLSRGTGFVELYIKADSLKSADWDVLADGLKWADRLFPAFKRVRMHGGDPKAGAVYGYTAWADKCGYVSFHNPSDREQTCEIRLDKFAGLPLSDRSPYRASVVVGKDYASQIKNAYGYGDTLRLTIKPRGILVIDFAR